MSQIIDRTGFVADAFADAVAVPPEDYSGGPALHLPVDADPAAVAAQHLVALDLIVIPFATSADGRGFSLARTLRLLGYTGHLRASGHVLVDQMRAALRSGFDDIEISDEQAARNPERQWQAVSFAAGYQSLFHPEDRAA